MLYNQRSLEIFYLIQRFKEIITETWQKNNISFYISESALPWNSDYKSGGTALITLNELTSAIIDKGHDPNNIGRWIFVTILGKKNKITSIFNMYRPGKENLEWVGQFTVIK